MTAKQNGKVTDTTMHQNSNDVGHVQESHPSTFTGLGTDMNFTKCAKTANEAHTHFNEDGKPLDKIPPPKSTSYLSSTTTIRTKIIDKMQLIIYTCTGCRDAMDTPTYNGTANKDQIRSNKYGVSVDNKPSPKSTPYPSLTCPTRTTKKTSSKVRSTILISTEGRT